MECSRACIRHCIRMHILYAQYNYKPFKYLPEIQYVQVNERKVFKNKFPTLKDAQIEKLQIILPNFTNFTAKSELFYCEINFTEPTSTPCQSYRLPSNQISIFRVICGASNPQCTHFLLAKSIYIFGGFLEPVSPSPTVL